MIKLTPQQTAAAIDCLCADRKVGEFDITLSAVQVWRTLLFKFRNKLTGECWPSRASIAAAAGVSLRTVANAIKELRRAGWLTWWRRRRGKRQDSSIYELRIPRRWRRTVSECKKCPGTTSISTKVAAGQLTRTDKVFAQAVKETVAVPPGYGDNQLAGIEDEGLRMALARLGAAIDEKAKRTGT